MGAFSDRNEYDLGYRYYPKQYPQSAGHPRLDIKISERPSEQHFDPDWVQFLIFSSADASHPQRIEHLKVNHPWTFQTAYRVAPGVLIISDRKDKKVEAFTFGGTLQIDVDNESTNCIIRSSAPIIELDVFDGTVTEFIKQVEIILARRRAIWAPDEAKFEARLSKTLPSQLYAACIEELIIQIEQDNKRTVFDKHDLYGFILKEKRGLISEGLWPEEVPSISEIL